MDFEWWRGAPLAVVHAIQSAESESQERVRRPMPLIVKSLLLTVGIIGGTAAVIAGLVFLSSLTPLFLPGSMLFIGFGFLWWVIHSEMAARKNRTTYR